MNGRGPVGVCVWDGWIGRGPVSAEDHVGLEPGGGHKRKREKRGGCGSVKEKGPITCGRDSRPWSCLLWEERRRC